MSEYFLVPSDTENYRYFQSAVLVSNQEMSAENSLVAASTLARGDGFVVSSVASSSAISSTIGGFVEILHLKYRRSWWV